MVSLFHLDTHVVLWLFGDTDRTWPLRVRELLDGAMLRYSPMVELELGYLHEIGRVRVPPARVLGALEPVFALKPASEAFADVARIALTLSWTRDPFDRLIVAQAIAGGAGLITHDETIRANFAGAVWE
jgi:PIN domain nuclease of toxin-antitoxin system